MFERIKYIETSDWAKQRRLLYNNRPDFQAPGKHGAAAIL